MKPPGGKLWRWKYRLQGKEKLFAIGGFLSEARATREKARALVKQGIIHPNKARFNFRFIQTCFQTENFRGFLPFFSRLKAC
ncbi:MAG: Arm DNA-binding domain-containing protein [Candidatus Accumulibacter sp.]|nr:Arm DNA-binding domain-containing protein [Accumulibacter sp.]